MSPKLVFVVAAGGAIGAVLRYIVYVVTAHLLGPVFPVATLIVNVLGSFAMGVLIEGSVLRWNITPELRSFVAIGLLGAFTTFSTFSMDAVGLFERGRIDLAASYVALSVVLSIAALAAGLILMRRVLV